MIRISGLLVAILLTTDFALACGDSLYRIGRGVTYRTYIAPLPGSLLVYATDDESRQIATELAASGHVVDFVMSDEQLADALGKHEYDVVIAPLQRRSVVATYARNGEAILPIVASRAERNAAREQFPLVLDKGDNIKRYLKNIHRTLKAGV